MVEELEGVLGMDLTNIQHIRAWNQKSADHKIKTKRRECDKGNFRGGGAW